jgi:tRNA A37 methylthiotransferase MiaB
MQRGYSREAYVSLVHRARALLGRGSPEGVGMGLSSDFIAGFCGETDEEHKESVSLLSDLGFDQAFTYAYSRREQTYAGLFYKDDVDEAVKARRLDELVNVFQTMAMERNTRLEMGRLHVVLVEGEGKRPGTFTGRTDSNKRVVFPWAGLLLLKGIRADEAAALARAKVDDVADMLAALGDARGQGEGGVVEKGVYIVVKVTGARGHTLRGVPLATTTIAESHPLNLPALPVN